MFTNGALIADIHGFLLGGLFLLAYSGGLMGLFSLRKNWETSRGQVILARSLAIGTCLMAVIVWLTVLVGTYLLYPLFRTEFNTILNSSWNTVVMDWKSHIGWFAPLLTTAVAYIVVRYRKQLAGELQMRRALIILFTLAFVTAGVAGLLGALTTKVYPVF